MDTTPIFIGEIPALLWGAPSSQLIVAVHGSGSHKGDEVIALLAREAVPKGYRVLSFDLPEHGDRQGHPALCKAQTCVPELVQVMAYAQTLASHIRLFGCSLGAYFGLLACRGFPLEQALFLSPVVDMERLIGNMMGWFQVTPQQLEAEGEISTPMGQTLYWDYYRYVKGHPIDQWDAPTAILCSSQDTLSEPEVVHAFARRFSCDLQVLEGGEHFFHTPQQLAVYRDWLSRHIEPAI